MGRRAIACALAAGLLVSSCAGREDAVPFAGGFAPSSPAGPESPPTSSAGPAPSRPHRTPEPSEEPSSASPDVGPVRLRTRTVRAGTVVVDDQGLTLYAFDKDKGDFESNCAGACAKDWPPVLTDGRVTVGPGINSALASTITRPDGTMQVEYNGWPLYHYAKDTEPRETKGQAVTAYGGPWYVLGDDGKRIKKKR